MAAEQWVSSSVQGLQLSAIKEMALRAQAVPEALSLTWGLPSFRTPPAIRAAVADALESDPNAGKYTLPAGLPEFRRLAAARYAARGGREIDPDREVIVTAGNMEAVKVLLRSLLDPGDEVIVTDPCFASHLTQIALCGGTPVFLALDESRGWQVDPEALEAAISPRSKALLLVTPHNPTGAVFARETLEGLARIAERHDLLLILDDPYSPFTYGAAEATEDPLAVLGRARNLAYLFTFSKAYAMSGWRVGYMILPEEVAAQVLKVHDATLICAPRISQLAAVAALEDRDDPSEAFRRRLDARRKLICERLDRVPELFSYVRPEGAYYVFPRIEAPLRDSWAFAMKLLNEAGVVVTPGVAFGPASEGHVRMAYCVADEVIEGAFDRIEAFLASNPFKD